MESRPTDRSLAHIVLPWLNLIIMFFPPIHLYFARGNMGMAMFFFMGSSVFLIGSMIYLHRAGAHTGEE
ncbi:MAG: hypothetical protein WBA42_14045 [Mesorhizobium sp.]|jgi:hypothetical protein